MANVDGTPPLNRPPLSVEGAGLGLRRSLLRPLLQTSPGQIDFLEVAPENWIGVGGLYGAGFQACRERFRMGCHGLSLSLGGMAPLNRTLLKDIRQFLDGIDALYYSEHLSSSDDGRPLYDLLPMPFTEEAVRHCATRIKQAQDALGRQIAVENISYYCPLGGDMRESDFVAAVVEEADCTLLLDINNVYVNSVNHGYSATDFIDAIPAGRVLYFHIAGHQRIADDLCLDTHGDSVIDPVWQLLEHAYRKIGVRPTVLEREANLPPVSALIHELDVIRACQRRSGPVISPAICPGARR